MSKHDYIFLVGIYLVISFMVMLVRAIPNDCAHRYVNYVVPLSLLHCEIRP